MSKMSSNSKVRKSPHTPEIATASSSRRPTAKGPRPKKTRRTLNLPLGEDAIKQTLRMDSGSDGDCDDESEEMNQPVDYCRERQTSRSIRDEEIMLVEECNDDCVRGEVGEEVELGMRSSGKGYVEGSGSESEAVVDFSMRDVVKGEMLHGMEEVRGVCEANHADFTWSSDFSSFSGQPEKYLRSPGPNVEATQDPVALFMTVWDEAIMAEFAKQTNTYAWQTIAQLSESGLIPAFLKEWTEITTDELYRYFGILMLMSLCYRSRVRDYWTTNGLEMQKFRNYMSRNRFLLISKFFHFVDNEKVCDPTLTSYEKKILKIQPVLDHCNEKFKSIYVPSKHLSLDESMHPWKGRLSRTKAAKFCVKSFELCEATTGYMLRCLLYAGKNSSISQERIHGFKGSAKVVLELMDGFLDVGHTLVMDNWYNQLPMTRYLKSRCTDVIGTMNPRRMHVPEDIKQINNERMVRGQQVARHCGDMTIIAWKDVKLVTAISTYHTDRQLPARRAGANKQTPEAIVEYNKYMGGVDSKDQKISMFPMERKKCKKWYMKVFKRLLNTSLLNAYIIYTKSPIAGSRPRPQQRDFRMNVAFGLLKRFPNSRSLAPLPSVPVVPEDRDMHRLNRSANHFVVHTDLMPGKNKRKQLRCVRCTAVGRRTAITLMCDYCKAALCPGPCWAEYHSLEHL